MATTKEKEKVEKGVFETLSSLDVNGHTEKKKTGGTELTYLSWAWAWAEVMKKYPDASYTIYRDELNRPYIEDPDFGLMCMTTVTINGQTREMWLPVMDGANKSMKRAPYTYQVFDYSSKTYKNKQVAAATMFDINKTIMRCLVKNLAMFGLGLYIYAGEDLPETPVQPETPAKPETPAQQPKAQQATLFDKELEEAFMLIKQNIESAPSVEYLQDLHKNNPALHNFPLYRNTMNKRFNELQ